MGEEQNPYQSPQAIELSHGYRIAPTAGRGGAPFASGRVLAFVAMVMVALVVLASLWLAASTYIEIGLRERASRGIPPAAGEATSNDMRRYLAGILEQVVSLVSAVTFLMWFYRVYRNLPALGNATPAHAPSGAVGWWFVPIASLVVPCQIARGDLERKRPDKHRPEMATEAGFCVAGRLLVGAVPLDGQCALCLSLRRYP